MFGRTSAITATVAAAVTALSSFVAAPATAAVSDIAPSTQEGGTSLQFYKSMSDTFSCDYYDLPWCRG